MRSCGILLPVFSLPTKYGVGTLGEQAYRFIDFLSRAGQRYWQMLPLCPTHVGDSPYQSFCDKAGNPYFIDLELLCKDGLLTSDECEKSRLDDAVIDYATIYKCRYPLLRKAFKRFVPDKKFYDFYKEQPWVKDYALFMAIKESMGGIAWNEFPEPLRLREKDALKKCFQSLANETEFHAFLQYVFYNQWKKLRLYATSKNIKIIGDIPIYVGYDSADVWCYPKQFDLNEQGLPNSVAGCPPDAFSPRGQLWGNPIYNWKFMEIDGFSWWISRMEHAFGLYDTVRIDHFRGLESYYAVPYGADDASVGAWKPGPKNKLISALRQRFGDMPIIAEDLGYMTDEVRAFLQSSGFPGMKVLQFAFDDREESDHLPHRFERNCVVYTGTHDNETLVGWCRTAPEKTIDLARQYSGATSSRELPDALIRLALQSVADTAVIPMQDWLNLDNSARINTPGTLGNNWKWRLKFGQLTNDLAHHIYRQTALYGRI